MKVKTFMGGIILALSVTTVAAFAEGGITNGDFSNELNGWKCDSENISVENGSIKITAQNNGSRVYQKVEGLENGIYNLTLTANNDDISGTAYVYAKSEGHTVSSTSIPQSAGMTKITVPHIVIDGGKCEIGIYACGSSTIRADNFAFEKSEVSRVPFLKGGEISKLTYVEDKGGKFRRSDGSEGDALQIMAENGFNLARIRLLNNPGKGRGDGTYYLPEGYQTEEDCLNLARRAKDKGMKILFSFAYSDYWSDGGQQFIPSDWQKEITERNLSAESLYAYLEDKTYNYTKDIMEKLIDQGTCPEYVSIGNEIQFGLYFGSWKTGGAMYNNADMLARFLTAGARAVREVSPDTKIILHSDNGGKLSKRGTFKTAIGKMTDYFDVIGVSYYPYYNSDVSIDTVVGEFNSLIGAYNKDVIIMETGYNFAQLRGDGWEGQLQNSGYYQNIYGETEKGQKAFLTELYAKLKQVSGGRCIGDCYWDPVMVYDGGNYTIGWAVKEDGDWTDANVVSNSTIFGFDGKEVEGQKAMKYNIASTDNLLITGKYRTNDGVKSNTAITLTVNGARYAAKTDSFGDYTLSLPYLNDDKMVVTMDGSSEVKIIKTPKRNQITNNVDFTEGGISDAKDCELIGEDGDNMTVYILSRDDKDVLKDAKKEISNNNRIKIENELLKDGNIKVYAWTDKMEPLFTPIEIK